jgi:hypothetical protein
MARSTSCRTFTEDEDKIKLRQYLKKIRSISIRKNLIKDKLSHLVRNKILADGKDKINFFISIDQDYVDFAIKNKLMFNDADIQGILSEYQTLCLKCESIRKKAREQAIKIGFLKTD